MKILNYMKKYYRAILVVVAFVIGWTIFFNLIIYNGFSGAYEHFVNGNEIYENKVTSMPFDELKSGVFSDGSSVLIWIPIDYPDDKIVSIRSKHDNNYTYHVENDNGNTKIVE